MDGGICEEGGRRRGRRRRDGGGREELPLRVGREVERD